jgi:hypothetical protein
MSRPPNGHPNTGALKNGASRVNRDSMKLNYTAKRRPAKRDGWAYMTMAVNVLSMLGTWVAVTLMLWRG